MIKTHKNTEDCETTKEFPEWGLYTNLTDITPTGKSRTEKDRRINMETQTVCVFFLY